MYAQRKSLGMAILTLSALGFLPACKAGHKMDRIARSVEGL